MKSEIVSFENKKRLLIYQIENEKPFALGDKVLCGKRIDDRFYLVYCDGPIGFSDNTENIIYINTYTQDTSEDLYAEDLLETFEQVMGDHLMEDLYYKEIDLIYPLFIGLAEKYTGKELLGNEESEDTIYEILCDPVEFMMANADESHYLNIIAAIRDPEGFRKEMTEEIEKTYKSGSGTQVMLEFASQLRLAIQIITARNIL